MEDDCDRCGAFAVGRRQWMFYQGMPVREFFCTRCLKVLRIYAAIGLTLLGLLLAVITGVVVWLRFLR